MDHTLLENIMKSGEFFYRKMADKFYEKNGIKGWITGSDHKYLNSVISSNVKQPFIPSAIKEVQTFFNNKNVPWSWVITPLCKPDNLEQILEDNDLVFLSSHATLWYDLQESDIPEVPEGFEIREVVNDAKLKEWNIPLSEGFPSENDPSRFFQLTAKIPFGGNSSFHHYVAYLKGKPISCATLSISQYGARLDNVATIKSHLRKGFARAITLFAMKEARKFSCKIISLDASDTGILLYKNLGFQEAYQNKVYISSTTHKKIQGYDLKL